METEIECRILNLNPEEIQKRLLEIGAEKIAERSMRRYVYDVDLNDKNT